ncbi:MAG: sugar transferase [Eggerthellaceae bacterium]|nr:sugar transferase [Eggerthellaceae bacterium]
MRNKKGKLAALAAGTAVAGATIAAALQKTRQLQDEARAKGAHVPKGPYEAVVKRPLDAALSGAALVVLAPVLGATAIAVRVKLGSPVIFKQQRPGLNAEPFDIYKFRTMTDERDPQTGELLPDEVRLTDFGKWLRSTSLDELPELANVLKGEMSLVGPRPLLVRYLPLYTAEQARRHEVRPGVTGLAQVRGRNSIPWEEKFQLDVEYVDNVTFAADAKALVDTVRAVRTRAGISSPSSVTMEEFTGMQADGAKSA